MSAPAKSNGRNLKNYEIIMLVVALTMILVLKLQKPATKKVVQNSQNSMQVIKK